VPASPAEDPLKVLFLPDFSDRNPYQRLLADGLAPLGIQVRMARAPGRDPLPIARPWLRWRPDVLHLHWTHPYLGSTDTPGPLASARFLGQLALVKGLGTRLVWTIHNLGGHEGSRSPAEMALHRRLFRLADGVICHCEAAVDATVEAYDLRASDRRRLHVIPHGNYVGAYPEPLPRERARGGLDLPQDARVLLFLGALREYKGVLELVRAVRALPDPDVHLVVAGSPRARSAGPDLTGPLTTAAAGDPRIHLRLDFVPDREVSALLSAADAVVVPFRDVLTSGSVILAMSFGRAVVAPALGCLPELCDQDGSVLYDPRGPDALARAIREALAADLPGLGRKAAERARQLSWGPIAAATAALYRDSG
jgi:beta-1,4-mannosyltransferase